MNSKQNIAIIGLGYVGLPLAVEFGKQFNVIGFDINKTRIEELSSGIDKTLESNFDQIKSSKGLKFSNNIDDLFESNIFIITVPTPIDDFKAPDLKPLLKASEMIGKLKLQYNRARQARITTELIEIISGASALEGKE